MNQVNKELMVPPYIISSLQKYTEQKKSILSKQIDSLTQFYLQNVLKYNDKQVPRLYYLQHVDEMISKAVPDQKILNTLYLQEKSVIQLVNKSETLVDIGFIIDRHLSRKVKLKDVDYADSIMQAVKSRVCQLLLSSQQNCQNLLCVSYGLIFLTHKNCSPTSKYQVPPFDLAVTQQEIKLLFNMIFRPLFEKKTIQKVYLELHCMIYWFIMLKDRSPSGDRMHQNQLFLVHLTKKINSFLWTKKTSSNFNLIKTFNLILELLSIKYLPQDSFSYECLAPVLNKLSGQFPLQDLINNWLGSQEKPQKGKGHTQVVAKKIQHIFRNSLNMGCIIFTFCMIKNFSTFLQSQKDYETLFYLFDSFIRKDYLNIKLPNSSFLEVYIEVLMLYTIGFINRDRLDGETQLNKLTQNLSKCVFKPKFTFDQTYSKIILFYRIYENRFQFLGKQSQKFVSGLQQIYRRTFTVAQIHEEVSRRIFKDYSADYDQASIYTLQRSERYFGLQNLGNTCYMNSFMQALFMTKKFRSLVIKARDQAWAPSDKIRFQTLVQLFSDLSTKSYQNKTEVNPLYFKETTPEPFKSSWQQHDSGQFGRMYLDSIVTQLKDVSIVSQKINRLFTHKVTNKIICKGCNTEREKEEDIFDFILNVDDIGEHPIMVSQLMERYFTGFELDDSNKLFCQKCNAKKSAMTLVEPNQFAEYLVATISIFRYKGLQSSKISKPLNFQFSLNLKNILPRFVKNDIQYDLYAFILHIGTGVQRGHYQCFARNLEENPMLWYKFDDHYVTEQEINRSEDFHFGQNETPYMLFYSSSQKHRASMSSSAIHSPMKISKIKER